MLKKMPALALAVLLVASLAAPATAADNSPPIAVDDPAAGCGGTFGSVIVYEDSDWWMLPIGASDACSPLANDSDPDGDPLTFELVEQPAHGEVRVFPGLFLEYRPGHDHSTAPGDTEGGSWVSDSITYRAFDGQAYSEPASVRIWVAPLNDPPIFTPGPEVVPAKALSGPFSQSWATDISPGPANEQGQQVGFVVDVPDDAAGLFVVPPAIDSNGVLTFEPGPVSGVAYVSVVAWDDGGLEDYLDHGTDPPLPDDTSEPAQLVILVEPDPDAPPVPGPDAISVVEDEALTVDVVANDVAPSGGIPTIVAAMDGTKGTVEIVDSTHLRYTPHANATGDDVFTYTIDDGFHAAVGTVEVAITGVNDAPSAAADSATTVEGPSGLLLDVLANDTDVDGDPLTATSVAQPPHGTTTIEAGRIRYVPVPGFIGTDTFDYEVSDGAGGTADGSVAVTVTRDVARPAVSGLARSLPAQKVGSSSMRVRLTWRGSDAHTGISRYQVQESVGGGAFRDVPLSTPTATAVTRTVSVGRTYRYRVRAIDARGNTSPYQAWRDLTPKTYTEGSAAIRWSGPWKSESGSGYLGGRARRLPAGSTAKFAFKGRHVAWVSARSSRGGRAEVRIDGRLVATLNLESSSTSYRQLVFDSGLAKGSHVLKIRSIGGGRVYIDSLIVLP